MTHLKNQHVKTRKYCVCVCVCVCACTRACVCDYMTVCQYALQNKSCKINYGKIISNVSAYISPIRLRNVAGDLAGERVRVSGWGKTTDSKYNFLIILHFDLKYCT
jgi:hypothetical protein